MKRVLIVDDDFLVRRYLASLIDWEANGYELLEPARDGSQALERIREFHPDIVLTDIDMPVMNGIDLLMQIRGEAVRPHVAVLSCHDDFAYVRESLRLGAEEYFLKDEVSGVKLLEILRELSGSEPEAAEKTAEGTPGKNAADEKQEEKEKTEELFRLLQGTSAKSTLIDPDAAAAVYIVDYEEKTLYQSLEKREQFYKAFSAMCENKAEGCRKLKAVHVRGGWFAVLFEFPDNSGRQEQQFLLQKNTNIITYEADRQFEISLRVGVYELQDCQNDVKSCWESAKALTGHAFYSRRNVFFGWQSQPMGTALPRKAQDFLDVAEEMRARRDRRAVQEAYNSVLMEFEREQTKESLVS